MNDSFSMPTEDAFVEVPGMRGLRIARVGQADGKTLEVVDGVKGVVIPASTSPGTERGRVVSGKVRFMRDGEGSTLETGETWEVEAGGHQGPHVFMEDSRVVILRDGKSGFDEI